MKKEKIDWHKIKVNNELYKRHGVGLPMALFFEIYDEAQKQKYLERSIIG